MDVRPKRVPRSDGLPKGRRRQKMINADKPHLWKNDVAASVDLYNRWFMKFAPKTYREKRLEVSKHVETGLLKTGDLENITPAVLEANPAILPMLRMSTCPPLAQDQACGARDSPAKEEKRSREIRAHKRPPG